LIVEERETFCGISTPYCMGCVSPEQKSLGDEYVVDEFIVPILQAKLTILYYYSVDNLSHKISIIESELKYMPYSASGGAYREVKQKNICTLALMALVLLKLLRDIFFRKPHLNESPNLSN
jgi:hypothetical protein